jgi:glycosyltransferase involved in cell wall biosynthesis
MLEDLVDRIHEQGLVSTVRLYDFTNDISAHMAKADVCLIPSLMKDPFPTTVLEAMSANKVVITTNHGGAKEAIVDGESGFLINPNDPKQFAKTILHCIHEKNTLTQVGQKAKERYEQLYTQAHFFDKWKVMTQELFFPNWENKAQIQTVGAIK